MSFLQGLVDTMNATASSERANYHLTLGQLVDRLEPHKGKGLTVPLCDPHSYRGYYCDLAFEAGETPLDDFLQRCTSAIGEIFEGYKGGDFPMGRDTPLWVAPYGSCGAALMDISVTDGRVVLSTKSVDDDV